MPGERLHPWPACRKKAGGSHHRLAEHPAFPARWLYGLYVLSSVCRAYSPPSPAGLIVPCRLSASVGAPGPHDFAVRLTAVRLTVRCGHRFPTSRIVTIGRNVPLAEVGGV